jgi:hypothetical protein
MESHQSGKYLKLFLEGQVSGKTMRTGIWHSHLKNMHLLYCAVQEIYDTSNEDWNT